MHRLVSVLGFLCIAVVIGAGLSASAAAQDQWGFGPVLVFTARNGGGNVVSFDVGEYRADRYQFGQLPNDSAYSVMVPTGYRVRFCENEGSTGQGSGKCEEVTEGNHNLRYGGTASYIRVWGPSILGRGGWNGGGEVGVTVYEDRDSRGRSQGFPVGRYLAIGNDFGNLRNDRASSVRVNRGFRVRLCENEGDNGRGSGSCEEYGEGSFNLRYNDTASFIEVRRTSGWGGGGWDGNPGGGWDGVPGGGGWNPGGDNYDRNEVTVFADPNQRGTRQQFSVGIYRYNANQFGSLKNDSASSVFVPNNYKVRLCENEGQFSTKGRCEDYGPGTYNLRYNDTASYIEVRRANDPWQDDNPWNGDGGWNPGGGQGNGNGVIVYVDQFQRGISQEFREGTYRFADRQFGRLPNDAASSIFVPVGFRVRLCENEGRGPKGERCEEYGPGSYNLAHNDMASSIFVWRN
ncbi:MAG: hypothetical protein JO053_10320 [Acidobacteria bacterium]|nr:hypothetical protein [Acidobacteriota bacterium]